MRASRSSLLLAVVALAGAAALAPAQDARGADEEWERDVAALAPGEETATTRVVDAVTREPIEGAQLTWYAEMEGLRAPALGTAVTDRHGLATLDWTAVATWNADSHFVVEADGYAPGYEWGEFPPAVVELRRPRTVRTRIVDLLGRPVSEAPVELFAGCGHGPIVRRLHTDSEGRLDIATHTTSETRLWVETPTVQADYLDLEDARGLGSLRRTLTLAPGGVARGVVLDPAGRPLEGVEVRSFQRYRGPIGLTDREGRYELTGIAHEAALYFLHPNALEGSVMLESDAWRAGTPIRLLLAPWGFAWGDPPPAQVLVRVRSPDGRAFEDPGVVLVREADGRVFDRDWSAEGLPEDVLRFDVPPGLYVAHPESPFSEAEFEPIPVEIRSGTPQRVSVTGIRRASLAIDGDVPEGATLRVAVEGAAGDDIESFTGDDPTAFVPSSGPVVVAGTLLGRTWFFPAAAAVDGVRQVTAAFPEPHAIDVALPDDAVAFVEDQGGAECIAEVTEDGLTTYASGDLHVIVSAAAWTSRIPVTLPADRPVRLTVSAEAIALHRETGSVRITLPEAVAARTSVDVTFDDGRTAEVPTGGSDRSVAARTGGFVHVTRPDYVPLRHRFDAPGAGSQVAGSQVAEFLVAWGDAAVSLRVADDDGDYVQVAVVVDGRMVPARAADDVTLVRVLGLRPGPHTLLVLPHDDAFLAKELRVVLRPGETRRRRLTLAWRD